MNTETEPKKRDDCRARWAEHKNSRCADLRKLWKAYTEGDEEEVPDLGQLHEYGLSFDYVAPGTFKWAKRGFWRYQISWGGPSEEFRFYGESGGMKSCCRTSSRCSRRPARPRTRTLRR